MERKYSLAEIDHMRRAVERKYRWEPFAIDGDYYNRIERQRREVEDKLRTYLVGGVDPADFVVDEQAPK